MLPDDIFIKLVDLELQKDIIDATDKDEFFGKALSALKETGTPPIKSKLTDWKEEEGILFFKERCYVPPFNDLRQHITQKYHDSTSSGHPGHLRTLELVRRNYWWPGMTVFVKNYVAGCATCQQMKIDTHPSAPGLIPIKAQKNARPFSQIGVDFITDLPESNGKDSIMVVVDHAATKGVISIPCNKTITAEETARHFIDQVYKRFGLPDIVNSA